MSCASQFPSRPWNQKEYGCFDSIVTNERGLNKVSFLKIWSLSLVKSQRWSLRKCFAKHCQVEVKILAGRLYTKPFCAVCISRQCRSTYHFLWAVIYLSYYHCIKFALFPTSWHLSKSPYLSNLPCIIHPIHPLKHLPIKLTKQINIVHLKL